MDESSEVDRETSRPGLRVELFVEDVPRSIAFYQDVLGFVVIRTAPSGYTSIGREGSVLGLNDAAKLPGGHPARPAPGQPVGRGVELVVMAKDVAAAHARAIVAGKDRVSELAAQPWGLTDFRVVDPDGYYVRVTSLSPANWGEG